MQPRQDVCATLYSAVNLAPLLNAPAPILPHTVIAFAAVAVGGVQLLMPKGTRRHMLMGYSWVGLLAFVAISGFFIHELRLWGPFSPIHLLSAFTLLSIWWAVSAARAGEIRKHQRIMILLYSLALILTGAFTFLPGRIMYEVVAG